MADGINRIGYSSSGIGGGYVPNRRDDVNNPDEKNEQTNNANTERTEVNPNDVMTFLAAQNYFMPVKVENAQPVTEVIEADADTMERIAGYMERFEQIYSIVEQEFGKIYAPTVMDLVMNKLMGMD